MHSLPGILIKSCSSGILLSSATQQMYQIVIAMQGPDYPYFGWVYLIILNYENLATVIQEGASEGSWSKRSRHHLLRTQGRSMRTPLHCCPAACMQRERHSPRPPPTSMMQRLLLQSKASARSTSPPLRLSFVKYVMACWKSSAKASLPSSSSYCSHQRRDTFTALASHSGAQLLFCKTGACTTKE